VIHKKKNWGKAAVRQFKKVSERVRGMGRVDPKIIKKKKRRKGRKKESRASEIFPKKTRRDEREGDMNDSK